MPQMTFGQIAFEAYGEVMRLPFWDWSLLDNDTRNAWEAVAVTVCKVYAATKPAPKRVSLDERLELLMDELDEAEKTNHE